MLDLRSRPHCGAHALPPVAREGDTPSGCPTLQVSRQMYASSPCSSLINCVVKHFHMLRPAENVLLGRWSIGGQAGNTTHTANAATPTPADKFVRLLRLSATIFIHVDGDGRGGRTASPQLPETITGAEKKTAVYETWRRQLCGTAATAVQMDT